MAVVYRYVDLLDGIIKYVGIVWGDYRTMQQRAYEHSREDKFKGRDWKIEILNVSINSKTEAECYESHYISLYGTGSYLNIAKSDWGLCSFLPDRENEWVEWHIPISQHKHQKRARSKKTKKEQKKSKIERRDDRGRVLYKGEYQKTNGMYEFRYSEDGIPKSLYSWKLVADDVIPCGKIQDDICLRDKIKNLHSNDSSNVEGFTLSEYFKKYIRDSDLGEETIKNYYFAFDKHYKQIKNMQIADIAFEDVYICLKRFAERDHPSLGTLRSVCSIINGVFQYGIQNGILDKNPARTVIEELRYDGVI